MTRLTVTATAIVTLGVAETLAAVLLGQPDVIADGVIGVAVIALAAGLIPGLALDAR